LSGTLALARCLAESLLRVATVEPRGAFTVFYVFAIISALAFEIKDNEDDYCY
jgi:hypothetical protein